MKVSTFVPRQFDALGSSLAGQVPSGGILTLTRSSCRTQEQVGKLNPSSPRFNEL